MNIPSGKSSILWTSVQEKDLPDNKTNQSKPAVKSAQPKNNIPAKVSHADFDFTKKNKAVDTYLEKLEKRKTVKRKAPEKINTIATQIGFDNSYVTECFKHRQEEAHNNTNSSIKEQKSKPVSNNLCLEQIFKELAIEFGWEPKTKQIDRGNLLRIDILRACIRHFKGENLKNETSNLYEKRTKEINDRQYYKEFGKQIKTLQSILQIPDSCNPTYEIILYTCLYKLRKYRADKATPLQQGLASISTPQPPPVSQVTDKVESHKSPTIEPDDDDDNDDEEEEPLANILPAIAISELFPSAPGQETPNYDFLQEFMNIEFDTLEPDSDLKEQFLVDNESGSIFPDLNDQSKLLMKTQQDSADTDVNVESSITDATASSTNVMHTLIDYHTKLLQENAVLRQQLLQSENQSKQLKSEKAMISENFGILQSHYRKTYYQQHMKLTWLRGELGKKDEKWQEYKHKLETTIQEHERTIASLQLKNTELKNHNKKILLTDNGLNIQHQEFASGDFQQFPARTEKSTQQPSETELIESIKNLHHELKKKTYTDTDREMMEKIHKLLSTIISSYDLKTQLTKNASSSFTDDNLQLLIANSTQEIKKLDNFMKTALESFKKNTSYDMTTFNQKHINHLQQKNRLFLDSYRKLDETKEAIIKLSQIYHDEKERRARLNSISYMLPDSPLL